MTSYLLPTRGPDLLLKPTDWCAICRDPHLREEFENPPKRRPLARYGA